MIPLRNNETSTNTDIYTDEKIRTESTNQQGDATKIQRGNASILASSIEKSVENERYLDYITGIEYFQNFTSSLSEKKASDKFIVLQSWEGIVQEVDSENEIFKAKLFDLQNQGIQEFSEFCFEEISEEDRELISTGAIFYWKIGYLDVISGQRTTNSFIRFRRLPVWDKKDIERESKHSEELIKLLSPE